MKNTASVPRGAPKTQLELVMEVAADLEVVVDLDDGRRTYPLRARELSNRGLFLKTDAALPLRRIVRVSVAMDDAPGQPLTAMAVVTRRVTVADARSQGITPGMGIELRGLGADGMARWSRWLRTLAQRYAPHIPVGRPLRRPSPQAIGPAVPPSVPLHLVGDRPPPADAVRRRHVRYDLTWQARLEIEGQLDEIAFTRDLSAGGACILTTRALEPGSSLHVQITNPRGEAFAQPARVVRRFVVEGQRAIGVVFVDMTPVRHRQLERCILDGLPEEVAEQVDEDTEDAWSSLLGD